VVVFVGLSAVLEDLVGVWGYQYRLGVVWADSLGDEERSERMLTLVGVGAGTGLLLVLGGSGFFVVVVVVLVVVGDAGADVGRLMLSVQRPPMHVMMYVWRGSRFAGTC
jgi:hypothetical protein